MTRTEVRLQRELDSMVPNWMYWVVLLPSGTLVGMANVLLALIFFS